MDDIERALPIFRGLNDRYIHRQDFITLFSDVFDMLLYKQLQTQAPNRAIAQDYEDNKTFWDEALKGLHFQGKRVLLQGFHVTEWLPAAPGRFFTENAIISRAYAIHFKASEREYLPLGKEYMILGGVGSIRLAAKTINAKDIYFLGASSTGISHQGLPIALFEPEYHKVIQIIKKYNGCFANITGTLQILPISNALFTYDNEIPIYCLQVDDVDIIRPSSTSELLVTVAITFPSCYNGPYMKKSRFNKKVHINHLEKSWAFCSFYPGSPTRDLNEAVTWLKDYALRYSGMENPPILSDFDEHYHHFASPIEFPISQIFKGNIDIELLKAYSKYYQFDIHIDRLNILSHWKGDFVSGDQINMSGNFQNVNVKSQLIQAAQSINALPNADQKTKDDLTQLVSQLSELLQQVPSDKATDAEKISKRVEALMIEAQKPDPDKEEVEFHVNSLMRAASSVAQFLPAVLPLATQIATYIGNIIH